MLCTMLCTVFFTLAWNVGVAEAMHDVREPKKRIVGGTQATSGDFPWMVALLGLADDSKTSKFQNQFCAGSLIDPSWVLTAAHCVDIDAGVIDAGVLKSLKVLIGANSLHRWYAESFDVDGARYVPEIRSVSKVIMHPEYGQYLNAHDVALLRLSTPSSMTATLKLENETATRNLPDSTRVLAVGFGDTTDDEETQVFDHVLRYVWQPLVPDRICDEDANDRFGDDLSGDSFFGYDDYYVRLYWNVTVCAGHRDDHPVDPADNGPCQGDSGGPLLLPTVDAADGSTAIPDSDNWRQIGIASSVLGGCADFYALYADTVALLPFIEDTMANYDDGSSGGGGSSNTTTTIVVVVVIIVLVVAGGVALWFETRGGNVGQNTVKGRDGEQKEEPSRTKESPPSRTKEPEVAVPLDA